jgi:hypothetical protein
MPTQRLLARDVLRDLRQRRRPWYNHSSGTRSRSVTYARSKVELMATTEMEARLQQLEETFSRRFAEIEEQVSQLKRQVGAAPVTGETAWWKKIVGIYQDDPEFEEAMRLGHEYRESLRPKEDGVEKAS